MNEPKDYLENVIGHSFEVEQLHRFVSKGNLPHALLFTGPEGTGKYYTALMLAWSLLNGSNDSSLDRYLLNGNHPDLHTASVAEGKKDIAVDDIREIISALQLKPYYARCSVALINDAHRMNIASANALLKTLEEPNPNTHLILVTSAPNRLPETIISRCQSLCFGNLTESELSLVLKKILAGVDFDPKVINNLLKICTGSISILGLHTLVNNRIGAISDIKALEEQIKDLFKDLSELSKNIEKIIAEPGDKNIAQALTLAASLGAEKDNKNKINLFWHLLKQRIRKELLSAPPEKLNYWAKWLEDAIGYEQLINERNANLPLQLSSFFANAM